MNAGKLLSIQYYPDDPFLLATGGDKGMVAIWESDEMSQIRDRFADRVVARQSEYAFDVPAEGSGGGGGKMGAEDHEVGDGGSAMRDLDITAGEEEIVVQKKKNKEKKKKKK
jgi:hypothetical protein